MKCRADTKVGTVYYFNPITNNATIPPANKTADMIVILVDAIDFVPILLYMIFMF